MVAGLGIDLGPLGLGDFMACLSWRARCEDLARVCLVGLVVAPDAEAFGGFGALYFDADVWCVAWNKRTDATKFSADGKLSKLRHITVVLTAMMGFDAHGVGWLRV